MDHRAETKGQRGQNGQSAANAGTGGRQVPAGWLMGHKQGDLGQTAGRVAATPIQLRCAAKLRHERAWRGFMIGVATRNQVPPMSR